MLDDIDRQLQEGSLLENAQLAIGVIIRPPRTTYALELPDDSIAPAMLYPVSFRNRHGHAIVGSLFLPPSFSASPRRTCVLYLHGNIGTQHEGRFLVPALVPVGISVFCFDFSGSGLSGGDFVTLGHREHEDALDAIDLLASQFGFTGFVLWGRSMGAACALMAAPRSDLIRGIIADSAYSSLQELFVSIADQTPLPRFLRPLAVWWIKHEVFQRAHFDCDEVNPALSGKSAKVPLMLGHCSDDELIPFDHAEKIFAEYRCDDKELVVLDGGHNGERDDEWTEKCIEFTMRTLGVECEIEGIQKTTATVEHAASFADLVARTA
jgi:pimeloyl-ACP methyl ester carboxylesterase